MLVHAGGALVGKHSRFCHGAMTFCKQFHHLSNSRRLATLKRMAVTKEAAVMSLEGFMQRVRACNTAIGTDAQFISFRVAGKVVGCIKDARFKETLLGFPDVFRARSEGGEEYITLSDELSTAQQRTDAVAGILKQLRDEGLIKGWREELYPVVTSFHEEPVMLMERAATVLFGIKGYGIHVNGYVRTPQGGLELWVARRSKSKPTWPGKLDHIVAGGQPHGLSCLENVVKECEEEASIPPHLAAQAVAVGAVSYTSLYENGVKRDVLFCYDLELPEDFTPEPQDGEVEEFVRMPIDSVAHLVGHTTEYKDNCNLVIIDFLIRHGYIQPDQPGYLELFTALRSGDCS